MYINIFDNILFQMVLNGGTSCQMAMAMAVGVIAIFFLFQQDGYTGSAIKTDFNITLQKKCAHNIIIIFLHRHGTNFLIFFVMILNRIL